MVVISKKKYSPGELISSELPFVHALGDEAKSNYCDSCLALSEEKDLKKCSGCKHMYYCSKECQKKDWISGHKYECSVFKQHYNKLRDDVCRQILRLYFVLKNNKKLASQKAEFQYDDKTIEKAFEDLVAHEKEFKKDQKKMAIFFRYIQIYNECNIEFDNSAMFELFCKCMHHSNSINLPSGRVGSALYLGSSSFGHSCSPNTTRIASGFRMEVRANKEINIGDEIFIRYIYLNQDKKSRQKQLKSDYFIDCHCQRCSSDFDKEIDYERMKKLETEMNLNEYRLFKLQTAWRQGKELIPLYKQIGGYDVIVTFHLIRMIELHKKIDCLMGDEMDFIDILKDIVEYLEITHGTDHELYNHYKGFAIGYTFSYGYSSSFFPENMEFPDLDNFPFRFM